MADRAVRAAGLRRYLATALCARFADEGVAVAVVLLALHRTGSAAQGAFVLTAWMAPHVVAAPVAGAAAARTRRPRLFHVAALGGFATAIVGLAVVTGRAPLPVTLLVAVLGGSCGPVVTGGLSSLLTGPAGAGTDHARAYALDAAVYNAASVAGPAVVSTAAALVSPGAAMGALGVAAGCAAALAARLPYAPAPRDEPTAERAPAPGNGPDTTGTPAHPSGKAPTPGPPPPGDGPTATTGARLPVTSGHRLPRGRTGRTTIPLPSPTLTSGFAALWRVRELRAITAATCVAFLGIGGLTTTTVLLAQSRGAPGAAGLPMTAFALGALSGSLAVARWWPSLPAPRLAAYGLWGSGTALAAAALTPSPAAALALFAAAGLCDGPLLTATLRIRAEHAPPGVRAQVFTLGAGLKITAAACGAALVGLGAGLPPAVLLLAIAALQLAAALLYVLLRAGGPGHALPRAGRPNHALPRAGSPCRAAPGQPPASPETPDGRPGE